MMIFLLCLRWDEYDRRLHVLMGFDAWFIMDEDGTPNAWDLKAKEKGN